MDKAEEPENILSVIVVYSTNLQSTKPRKNRGALKNLVEIRVKILRFIP